MPHRLGLASRRFYRSFYHWTILTDHSRLSAGRHAFHTTRPACEEGSSVVRYQKSAHHSYIRRKRTGQNQQDTIGGKEAEFNGQLGAEKQSGRQNGRRRGGRNRQAVKKASATAVTSGPGIRRLNLKKDLDRRPKFLTEDPVLSPSEKPFHSFKANEKVVRYRSPEGLMLEYAMPGVDLERARAKFGPALKGLSERSGARIEVQNLTAPLQDNPDEQIHSVLISGAFDQVTEVIGLFNSSVGAYTKHRVIPQESLPSRSLIPLQYVLRGRKGSQVHVEMSLRDVQWSSISQDQDWAKMAMAEDIALEVCQLEDRPLQEESDRKAPARSLTLKGPADAVAQLRSNIATCIATTRKNVCTDGTNARPSSIPAPNVSAPDKIGSPVTNEVGTKTISSDEAIRGTDLSTSSRIAAASSDKQNGDTTLPRPDERLTRRFVNVHGEPKLSPATMDAIWNDLSRRTYADVRIFRNRINHAAAQWKVEVIGSLLAVEAGMEDVKAVVAESSKSMQSGRVWTTCGRVARRFSFTFRFTGKDAMTILAPFVMSPELGRLKKRFGLHYGWIKPPPGAAQWDMRVVTESETVAQVRDRMQETVEKIGEELKASDVEVSVMIETLKDELPGTAASAGTILPFPRVDKISELVERSVLLNVLKSTRQTESPPMQDAAPAATSTAAEMPPSDNGQETSEFKQPEFTHEQQKQLSEDVRASLRSLTHPVVLVTSRIKASREQLSPARSARGVTVSSFNTVTLDPRPIISFNLKVPSRSWDAMQQSKKLRVHLLEASNRGAAIAQVFTKPYERPHMGFKELREIGVDVKVTRANRAPIVQDEQGAVLARLEAELLPEKCVEVGDHIVVLAEVTGVDFGTERHEEVDGLAYAKRGYRTRGSEVDPKKVVAQIKDGPYDALSLGIDGSTPQVPTPLVGDEGPAKVSSDDPYEFYDLDDDPIYSALRATKQAAESGKDIDIYAAMAWEDEGLDDEAPVGWTAPQVPSRGRKVRAEETQSNTYFARRPLKEEALPTPSAPVNDSASTSGTTYIPFSSPSSRRDFSTLSPSSGSRRSFSSTAIAHRRDGNDTDTLDPSAKHTTVADYLGVPDDNKPLHAPRVRSLIGFRKDIRRAESRLSTEDLSEEDATALRDSISHKERIIARKLAWNAAADLRLMLDKGSARVDFKRAQWLESAVEQGLKVLLDDARTLRQKREGGKVDAEKYEALRKQLEGDHGVLQTELMRLRGVVDEDEEGSSE